MCMYRPVTFMGPGSGTAVSRYMIDQSSISRAWQDATLVGLLAYAVHRKIT